MTYFVWQRDASTSIASSRRVLRAAELPSLTQADQLCRDLEALARDQPAQLAAQLAQARAEGFEQGLREGREASRDQNAAALQTMTETLHATRQQLQADTASLALAVVGKLMGRFSNSEQLAGLADTAAREAAFGTGESKAALVLTVHPDQVQSVQDQLDAVELPEQAFKVDVQGDASCAIETCRIDSELGSVDATLSVQLSRLARAWREDQPNDARADDNPSAQGI